MISPTLFRHSILFFAIFTLPAFVPNDVQAQGRRLGNVVALGGGQGLRVFNTELVYPVDKSNGLGDRRRAQMSYYQPQSAYRPAPSAYRPSPTYYYRPSYRPVTQYQSQSYAARPNVARPNVARPNVARPNRLQTGQQPNRRLQTNRGATGNVGGRPIFTPYRPAVAAQRRHSTRIEAPESIYDGSSPFFASNTESNEVEGESEVVKAKSIIVEAETKDVEENESETEDKADSSEDVDAESPESNESPDK